MPQIFYPLASDCTQKWPYDLHINTNLRARSRIWDRKQWEDIQLNMGRIETTPQAQSQSESNGFWFRFLAISASGSGFSGRKIINIWPLIMEKFDFGLRNFGFRVKSLQRGTIRKWWSNGLFSGRLIHESSSGHRKEIAKRSLMVISWNDHLCGILLSYHETACATSIASASAAGKVLWLSLIASWWFIDLNDDHLKKREYCVHGES